MTQLTNLVVNLILLTVFTLLPVNFAFTSSGSHTLVPIVPQVPRRPFDRVIHRLGRSVSQDKSRQNPEYFQRTVHQRGSSHQSFPLQDVDGERVGSCHRNGRAHWIRTKR